MELLNQETVQGLTENTATIQLQDGMVVTYKEWVNSKGKVVDTVIRSKDGYDIGEEDPGLFDEICDFIEGNGIFEG